MNISISWGGIQLPKSIKNHSKLVLLLAFILLVGLSFTACDNGEIGDTVPDTYNAEVIIEEVANEEHVEVFSVLADGESGIDQFSYEDNKLTGDITDLSGTTELTLVVDNDSLTDGEYTIDNEVIEVDTNNNEAKFEVEFIEKTPEIEDIDVNNDVNDISVETGTTKEDVLDKLVNEIVITDTEDNNYTVNLDWTIEDYNSEVAKEYSATGTFELPKSVEQTDPATDLEVTAKVTVEEVYQPSKDASLSNLGIDPGHPLEPMEPEFDSEITDYTINVNHYSDKVHVYATPYSENASLEINGELVPSGEPKELTLEEAGRDTIINFIVTAEDERTEKQYILTVSRVEEPDTEYNLTIEVEGEGTTEPEPGTHEINDGEIVDIKAIPDGDYQFVEWEGNVQEPENEETSILMENDETVKAYFVEEDDETDPIVSREMVLVEAGTTSSDNGSITVENDFYMGKYHVTQAEFEAVMSFNPSYFNDNHHSKLTGNSGDRPVEMVTWYDAIKYANELSEIEGFDKYYNISVIEYRDHNIVDATVTENTGANGYRLPTEAEHEYAARGGKDGNSTTYAGSDILDEVGWYSDNSDVANSDASWADGKGTMPVGENEANELGLYDMSGNVWDWTNTESGPYRFRRGGSWFHEAVYCEVTNSYIFKLYYPYSYFGFRLARRP